MSKNCEMIKDLLPLYTDDVCSEESRKAVEEHIKECPECKAELEKLRKNVTVSPQKDTDVLKRIKRRLRTENIIVGIISALTLLCAMMGVIVYMANTMTNMDYDDKKLENCISVVEEENGDVRLICNKIDCDRIFSTVADIDGAVFGDPDFDKEKKCAYGVTFMERRINIFSRNFLFQFEPEHSVILFNTAENTEYDTVFYYDKGDKQKHILWERDKND